MDRVPRRTRGRRGRPPEHKLRTQHLSLSQEAASYQGSGDCRGPFTARHLHIYPGRGWAPQSYTVRPRALGMPIAFDERAGCRAGSAGLTQAGVVRPEEWLYIATEQGFMPGGYHQEPAHMSHPGRQSFDAMDGRHSRYSSLFALPKQAVSPVGAGSARSRAAAFLTQNENSPHSGEPVAAECVNHCVKNTYGYRSRDYGLPCRGHPGFARP